MSNLGFSQVALVLKNLPANAGDARDVSLISGLGSSPGGGHGNPLQNSCLENPMDRGAWWVSVHGVAKSWTGLDKTEVTEQHIMHKGLIIFHSSLLILIVVQYRILRIEAISQ